MNPALSSLSLPFAMICLTLISGARIDKKDGGYEDIVVAINPSVQYDENIITNIKALFRSGSEFLHRATNGRVFFKDVTISVPSTWPRRKDALETSSSLFEKADVRVDVANPHYGDTPYTLQPRGCGERGQYIHVTPGFLTGPNNSKSEHYGSPAYQLVHEWAHYRYGVFDEYGKPGDYRYPNLYCEFGMVMANACQDRIRFVATGPSGEPCTIYRGCKVSRKCEVQYFLQDHDDPVTSSIMFMPQLPGITQFCDNSVRKHNTYAPNKQNHLCQRRSTWEVIEANEDFKGLPNPNPAKTLGVQFREVQQRNQSLGRAVMVLDVSGSMSLENRLEYLKKAAGHFIEEIVPGDLELGIVLFSNGPVVLENATVVTDDARRRLMQKVSGIVADGGTCIGCGLREATKLLESGGKSAEGGVIMLMTDGEENVDPKASQVLPELVSKRIIVNTLALGGNADNVLERLALGTGGKAFSLRDGQANFQDAMASAFLESTTTLLDDNQRSVTILNRRLKVALHEILDIVIDGGLGSNTTVSITSSQLNYLKTYLLDPSGKPCDTCVISKAASASTWYNIHLPSPAMPGTWKLVLNSTSSEGVSMTVRATSMMKDGSEQPIRLRTYMKQLEVGKAADAVIYSEVSKGPHAVLRAKVVAHIMRPTTPPTTVTVELFDNGIGADVTANDGIYSAYFTQFEGRGRYSIIAEVVGSKSTVVAKGREASGALPAAAYYDGASPAAKAKSSALRGLPLDQFVYVDEDIEVAEPIEIKGEEASDFVRFADGGSFRVDVDISKSTIPPGSIQDLRVEDVSKHDNGSRTVRLSWTCPGNHLYEGKASIVEIRASTNLAGDFLSASGGISATAPDGGVQVYTVVPLPAGTRQEAHILLPEDMVKDAEKRALVDYYFVAWVKNDAGVWSEPSNFARATFEHPKPPASSTTTATPSPPDTTGTTETPGTPSTSGLTSTPETPGTPSTASTPGTTGATGTPGTPGRPRNTSAPGTPVVPSTPGTTGTTETLGTPSTPGTTGTTDTPGTPSTPGNTRTPATPGTPSTPGTTGTTETPSRPRNASTPGTPGTPSTPGTTGTTEARSTPSRPGNTSTPETPGTPRTPVTTGTTDTPSGPRNTSTPGTPGTPRTPATPSTPSTPSTPVTKSKPGTSSASSTPSTINTWSVLVTVSVAVLVAVAIVIVVLFTKRSNTFSPANSC